MAILKWCRTLSHRRVRSNNQRLISIWPSGRNHQIERPLRLEGLYAQFPAARKQDIDAIYWAHQFTLPGQCLP